MIRSFSRLFFLWAGLASAAAPPAQAAEPVRIGALAFGTLSWELDTIRQAGLDQAHGIRLQTQTLASPQAGQIALLSNSVDLVVGDWIWVSRQRENGADFTFIPYSTSHGALVTPAKSAIQGVADLAGKRLGVAGGGLDKNWLLLRALAKKQYGLDLAQAANVVFGAPPLLNEQLQQGKLDAVLDYWHYAAKLEAKGYRQALSGQDILRQLGAGAPIPSLGYVFREGWAQQHPAALDGFLAASQAAKRLLCESDEAWGRIVPLTQEKDPAILANLRWHYCAGRVRQWGAAEQQASAAVYRWLKQTGGEEAAGKSDELAPGTFWPHYRLAP